MSWWRRQRLALAGLAVAAAAAVSVHVWFDVLPTTDDAGPVITASDGTAEVGGHRLSVEGVEWGEFSAPDGSTTLSVTLRAHSADEAELCGTFLLSEAPSGREWLDARGDVDVRTDDERSCRSGSGAYRILAVFLLPEDASGPFWLDAPIGSADVLRIRVDG